MKNTLRFYRMYYDLMNTPKSLEPTKFIFWPHERFFWKLKFLFSKFCSKKVFASLTFFEKILRLFFLEKNHYAPLLWKKSFLKIVFALFFRKKSLRPFCQKKSSPANPNFSKKNPSPHFSRNKTLPPCFFPKKNLVAPFLFLPKTALTKSYENYFVFIACITI